MTIDQTHSDNSMDLTQDDLEVIRNVLHDQVLQIRNTYDRQGQLEAPEYLLGYSEDLMEIIQKINYLEEMPFEFRWPKKTNNF